MERINSYLGRSARKTSSKESKRQGNFLRIIRRYIESGVIVNGVKRDSKEGVPQGDPFFAIIQHILG
jgi:hypothetical protein